jgi:Protein of unknown function (DUF2515)
VRDNSHDANRGRGDPIAAAPVLAGFEAIDSGHRVLVDSAASPEARRAAVELIWRGNVQLLEHEQRELVQPNFDRLSCPFARLFSMGSALSFKVRGLRHEASYFTSFYASAFGPGPPYAVRSHPWPRITRFDDRWRWYLREHRPALPQDRRRRAPARWRPAPDLRRGARLRLEPLPAAARYLSRSCRL